jgi:chromosome segregation protein
LLQAQREFAALEERLRSERRRATSLASQREGLTEELSLRAQRLAELDGEQAAHKGQLERLETEIRGLRESLDIATAEREPLATQVEAASRQRDASAGDLEAANQDLLARERVLGQRELLLERARAEHAAITLRIFEDLSLEEPESLLEADLGEIDEDDAALSDPTVAEREIARLKERLRRVGYVGEDVVNEYEREAEHHAFLRAQLEDVEAASASLRSMLQDLHETMHTRFEETFSRVAEAFTSSFTILFGGGTARLVLTTDEESESGRGGIDIVAQPPGKRLQNLSLLSGGERSLTGVALLFAILRVSPSPFVLLDEVDAALDEANVLRFREQLRVLASETQAIVITHNRGTVEIADTLYGITMGGDGISQMLSLKLSDVPMSDDATTEFGTLVGIT